MNDRRILIFAPYGAWVLHHQLDAIVGAALQLRGCQVKAITCDGIFDNCPISGNPPSRKFCGHCADSGSKLFSAFGIPTIQLRSLLTDENMVRAREWVQSTPGSQLPGATFDGSPLGEWVTIQMHSMFKRSNLDYTHEGTIAAHRSLLFNLALIQIAFSKFIDSWRPDHVLCYSGVHAYYRTVLFLSRKHDLPVLVHERGSIDDSFRLFQNATSIFNPDTLSLWEQWKDIPLWVEEAETVKKMLVARETGKDTNFLPSYQYTSDECLVRRRLRIPSDAPIVSLFTGGDWEYGIMEKDYNSPSLFPSQDDWVQATAEIFARRNEYLVVRHHPLGAGTKTFPPAKAFLARQSKINLSMGPNVRVIMPNERITSYSLLWNSDACLITYGTIGSEAIPRGVATVSMANMLFTPMGIKQVANAADYGSAIDEAIVKTRHFSAGDLSSAYRYLYYVYYRMNHRFRSFGIRNVYSPDIRIKGVSDLKEGIDPALDHVCKHILFGAPLFPPPDGTSANMAEPESRFLEQELAQIRERRARVSQAVRHASEWKESSLAVIRARQDGKFRNHHHMLGKSVERSRHQTIVRMEIPAPYDDFAMLLEALKDVVINASAEIIYVGADNVCIDESVFSESLDLLSKSENAELDGVLWGAWITDGEEDFQHELFTERCPVDSFNALSIALPRMADPIHLLSFVVMRRASLRRLVETLSQHSNPSQCIYEMLLAPHPMLRVHRTMNSLLVFYGRKGACQLISEAKQRLKEGKAEEALRLLEDARTPEDPEWSEEIQRLRISAKVQSGNWVEARTACESAIRNHPSHEDYRNTLTQLIRSEQRYESIASAVESIDGYLSPGQEKFLYEKVMSLPTDAAIVEVGGYLGRSTCAMAFACVGTQRHIFCIDTFFGNDGPMGRSENFFDVWKANLQQFDLLSYVTPISGYSHDVLSNWGNRPAPCFIFMDGSHEYEDVLRDLMLSYPLLKSGGWIAFHDFEPGWPGPWRVWIESASQVLADHEYCSNLACGRKLEGRSIPPLAHGAFSYSREWALSLSRIGPALSAAMLVSLGHGAPGGDRSKFLNDAETVIARMPERLAATLRAMLGKDAQGDSHLHFWNALTLEHRGDIEQARIEYQTALKGADPATAERIHQRRRKQIGSVIKISPAPASHAPAAKTAPPETVACPGTSVRETTGQPPALQYYDQTYFDWQKEIGQFGGWANLFKFAEHIQPDHHVVDFGCGGGFLLGHIACRQKLGVEVNPHARAEAQKHGIPTVATAEEIPEGWADTIISNHALEHVSDPVGTLKQLLHGLKPGGRMVFVVPHQDVREAFNSNDRNKHLFTWNPQTLGNLFQHVGMEVGSVDLIQHQWPPNYLELNRRLGPDSFHAACRKHAQQNGNYQIRVVARKPSAFRPHALAGKSETPVVLMAYNRPQHTAQVLEALRRHGRRELYVFSDGPKNPGDSPHVEDVRKLISAIDWCRPVIVEREENLGLARSITSAVDQVFEQHDRIILLEDDCVPQTYFFQFVEDCLDRYQDHDRIFGISGYTVQHPQTILDDYPYDLYFSPRIGSWGWATWKQRWRYRVPDLRRAWNKAIECGIDLSQGGDDVPDMLRAMLNGTLTDVWTLNWLISVYLQRGYFIYPTRSHIRNIGMDGSGVHCGATTRFASSLAENRPSRYPSDVSIHEGLHVSFRRYYDRKRMPRLRPQDIQHRLRVVHLCAQDFGGAGKAAYRLHKGMESVGVDSTMTVMNKQSGDPSVKVLPSIYKADVVHCGDVPQYVSPIWKKQLKRWETLLSGYPQRPRGLEMYTDAHSDLQLEFVDEIRRADIVHLHWVAGQLNIPAAPAAFRDKRLVWTLHDMNPFTGGCHYAGDCQGYIGQCGCCPQLRSQDPEDLSHRIWRQKQAAYRSMNFQLVTPSRWLAQCVRCSSLMNRFSVATIPNGLPLDIFKPHPKAEARGFFGIDLSAKVVLFGADSVLNARKGIAYLVEALNRYAATGRKREIAFAFFGETPEGFRVPADCPVYKMGSIRDEKILAMAYSAADAFVIPSLEDNLPNTALEALACGVPLVGFNIGGIPDLIERGKTGYLAAPNDVDGLMRAMDYVMSEEMLSVQLSQNCRAKAEREYDLECQASAYLNLYEALGKDGTGELSVKIA
jgi:glycosyltransferase involved in cell wall biosynthesis/SAM-dependent methyltransferase/predicted O-methyltransferase YrrM